MQRSLPLAAVLLCACLAVPTVCVAAPHDDLPASDSVQPQLYATGFEFAEGPVLDSQGNLFVVNYRGNGNIGRIAADGTAEVFCDLRKLAPVEGRDPQANGLKLDSERRLIAADAGAARLLRIAADGKSVEVLADRWEDKRFNAINDVALDRAGNIYFSDPGGSSAKDPIGSVYRYDIATAKVTRLATGLAFPNGLAVVPDENQVGLQHLYLAESQEHRILTWDLTADGTLTNGQVLINFPKQTQGDVIGGAFEPDGMILDASGRLYVAMYGGGLVNVIDVAAGTLIRQYKAGGLNATNCHFHGGYLYVTVASKEAVFRLKLGVAGFDYHERSGPDRPAIEPTTRRGWPEVPFSVSRLSDISSLLECSPQPGRRNQWSRRSLCRRQTARTPQITSQTTPRRARRNGSRSARSFYCCSGRSPWCC